MKSLKARSSGPSGMVGREDEDVGVSWFRIMERMACVPQAFWIVCAAKKRFSGGEVSYVPSRGVSARAPAASRVHLKRKMTP